MTQGKYVELSVGQRTDVWRRWKAGESLHTIGPSIATGEASEIAQAYLFLMQEGFGTGQTVVIDGGTVLV